MQQDLAASIKDGRWNEQKARLLASGCKVFYFLEGDFKSVQGLPYAALLGAYSTIALLEDVEVLRTADINETKYMIVHIANKCQAIAKHPSLDVVCSKRRKQNAVEDIWVRQLACIPTISDSIAAALIHHFGSLSALREALTDPASFPLVRLSRGSCLGKKRIAKLAEVFLR